MLIDDPAGKKLLNGLKNQPFSRGLPARERFTNPDMAYILGELVRKGSLSSCGKIGSLACGGMDCTSCTGMRQDFVTALEACYQAGWVHKKLQNPLNDDGKAISYVFASPVHRWYSPETYNELIVI